MRRRAVLLLVPLALLGASCGDDNSSTARPSSSSSTTATSGTAGSVDLTRLPLGDSHVKHAPGVGDLDLCSSFPTNGPGARVSGSWIHGVTFDLTAKAVVRGDVAWPEARFSAKVDGSRRVLTGNDLPVNHHTGAFPIANDDPAAQVDRNPSAIRANEYTVTVPATPTAASTPGCVGGEVGFLVSGVILNSPVDAMGRDAVAHKVQDGCGGHPNDAGYHYHSVPTCIDRDDARHELVGYALDGYGIFGRHDADGKVITNADLDACHGHTHAIDWDGKPTTMYHYHATWEFPYVVGCFHGTYTPTGPVLGAAHQQPYGPAVTHRRRATAGCRSGRGARRRPPACA